MQLIRMRQAAVLAAILAAGAAWSPRALADEHVTGVITARGADGTLAVQTEDSSMLTVVLNDATKVRRTDGMRQLKVSSASLIPGLRVQLAGEYEGATRFAAQRVSFSRSDLKMALAIKGGVDPTDVRSLDNQRRITANERTIEQQQQTLARQADQIATNREQIRANADKIVATTGALDTRIANLDNYKAVSTVTVYFRNGNASVAKKYKTELQELAARAKDVNGYVIQVQGYASAVGADALNKKLSMQRADNVAGVLTQSGIPPTNMVVPAQMGTSEQVASNKTAKGQAENRRTVVTLLQNKGISER